jgi:ABC-type uncharacterized transport system, periplasmic component
MGLVEQYISCYPLSRDIINESRDITVKELSEAFCCSERNAKLVLHKMQDNHWIAWQPGRGRGHKSQITFYEKLSELLIRQSKEWIDQGKLNKAMDLLNEPNMSEKVKEELHHFLQDQFGLHTEYHHARPLDVIRIPFGRRLSTLDPLWTAVTTESHLSRQIFDSLVRYNLKTHSFEPHLAHHWSQSPDQTQWLFYLRKGVRFHHGRELTAEDVLYTFRRIREASSPCSWYFDHLIGAEAAGSYAVKLTFSRPAAFLLHLLSSLKTAILPADIGFQENQLSGTGPFRLIQKTDDTMILERFQDYFRECALIDRVAFYQTRISSATVSHYKTNQQHTDHVLQTHFIQLSGCRYLSFNFNKKGPQLNTHFRLALRIICDRIGLIQELKGDREEPANSFLRIMSRRAEFPRIPLQEARPLLMQSGYHGETIQLYCFDQKGSKEDAEWIRQRAESVGLKMLIHPFAMTRFFDSEIDRDADLLLCGEIFEEDWELGYISLLKDKTVFFRRFLNEEQRHHLDLLANVLMMFPDSEKRLKVIDEIEDYLRHNLLILFNYHADNASIFSGELAGIELNAYGWADFSKLWIRPESVRAGSEIKKGEIDIED